MVCKLASSDPGGMIPILRVFAMQKTVSILTTPGMPTTAITAFKVGDDGVAALVIICFNCAGLVFPLTSPAIAE